ncbi:MAG TPA: hypothetical protein VFU71_22245 [Burkholderiaceae bacterium]|nr:hypothetical protein [Burkholderiaceae bacterium]
MKKTALAVLAACVATAPHVLAADTKPSPKKRVVLDMSSEALIDSADATALVSQAIPAAVWKVYPPGKWGVFSQVIGGFTSDKICVVTARVMLAPLTVTNGIIMRPASRAAAYDAKVNATEDECRAIARAKLKEATESVVSSLVKS